MLGWGGKGVRQGQGQGQGQGRGIGNACMEREPSNSGQRMIKRGSRLGQGQGRSVGPPVEGEPLALPCPRREPLRTGGPHVHHGSESDTGPRLAL